MSYVDGYVLPVPKKRVREYLKLASIAAKVWRDHGALQYCEAVGEDLNVPWGTSFSKLAKTKPSETVIFAWIVYKSRAHRDAVNKKVMSDKRLNTIDPKNMPFDMKRMAYGGFDIRVNPKITTRKKKR